jgi:hypothetical protein
MSRFFKSAAFPILIVVVLAFFAQKLIGSSNHGPNYTFGNLLTQLDQKQVKGLSLDQKSNQANVTASVNGETVKYSVGYPDSYAPYLIRQAQQDVPPQGFNVQSKSSNGWLSLLTYILPFVIFIGFWIFLMNQVQGGGSKVMSFGKSRAKRMSVDSPKITFRDVAGVDEAVEELHEIKEFLENPKKFQALGARIPKGVPARPCWPAPSPARRASRSSRSQALTSSRCSSAWAPRACVTCSSRPSRTPPASSSWTRSTPSVAIAAPAWAAVTTSASRRSISCSSRWTASR